MIRPLRRLHAWLWLGLSVLLLAGVLASLQARKSPAVNEPLPATLR